MVTLLQIDRKVLINWNRGMSRAIPSNDLESAMDRTDGHTVELRPDVAAPIGDNNAAGDVLVLLARGAAGPICRTDPDAIIQVLADDGLNARLEMFDPAAGITQACGQRGATVVLIDDAAKGSADIAAILANKSPGVRCVLLAERADDAGAVAAVKAGAFDYVHRDALARLPLVVRRAVADIDAQARIAALARTDALTGLANRHAFIERASLSVASAHRDGIRFAVIYLDLDNFKDINDTLGHLAGDALLIAVADRLRRCVRETDLVARLGGDEFAILQAGVREPADCGTLAAKLLASLAVGFHLNGNARHISTSIGIAIYQGPSTIADEMMMQADTALYRAKDEGRNRYCFFTPELDHEVRERVSLTEELLLAFQRDEFELWYQPQVSQPDGRIVGLEALLRWNHPRRGRLLPGSFMPAAEKSRLLANINRFVLTAVCRQISAWRDAGVPLVKMAINVTFGAWHPPQDFTREVMRVLGEYGVSAPLLDFELSEASLADPGHALGFDLQRIQLLGVRLVADRFGHGPMLLDRIGTYGFSRLKIAPHLMADDSFSGRDWVIVRSAIRLAQDLGVSVVATGVETVEQVRRLMDAGCYVMQGFYFSAPVSAADAGALLRGGEITAAVRPLAVSSGPKPDNPAPQASPEQRVFDDMALLLEKLPVAVCVFDAASGVIEHVNDAFIELFGYPAAHFADIAAFWEQTLPDQDARRKIVGTYALHFEGELIPNRAEPDSDWVLRCQDGSTRRIDIRPAACERLRILAFIDITAQRSREQQLEILASYDEMTNFLNRRAFLERAQQAVQQANELHEKLALIVFDMDRFKSINDAFGHTVGDRVLQILPQAVRTWLRERDLVGRTGGEEFMIMLPGSDAEGARLVAERVRSSILTLMVRSLDGQEVRFSASFGISALFSGEQSMENLIIRADTALYLAKGQGGNAVKTASRPPRGADA